jgi:hypothetical protein
MFNLGWTVGIHKSNLDHKWLRFVCLWFVECCQYSQPIVTNGRLISTWLGKDVEGSIPSGTIVEFVYRKWVKPSKSWGLFLEAKNWAWDCTNMKQDCYAYAWHWSVYTVWQYWRLLIRHLGLSFQGNWSLNLSDIWHWITNKYTFRIPV